MTDLTQTVVVVFWVSGPGFSPYCSRSQFNDDSSNCRCISQYWQRVC